MFWDFHESKRYPCTQKISFLALKLTILGLKNFMGKMLILGTPFQPLCMVAILKGIDSVLGTSAKNWCVQIYQVHPFYHIPDGAFA